ncbi:ATP-binding protein [Acidithiobacillus ferrooxidans]|nr:ATP-binding protein [Acidithiobacillus ferrooxidans]
MLSSTLIDDFGLKPMRPPHDEDFHDLIAERYERVSTMLTSNLDFAEWGDVFPANRMLGVATLDRLRHGTYRLILEGDSFRAPRPLPESPKNTIAKGAKNTHS